MNLTLQTFLEDAWNDYLYQQTFDKNILKRINNLIKDIQREPFHGIGKPEPLKFDMAGYWSRRITEDHRLVYKTHDHKVIILQCRYHY